MDAASAYRRAQAAVYYAEKARKEADILIARSRSILRSTDEKLASYRISPITQTSNKLAETQELASELLSIHRS